jgi:beta-glucosidase
MMTTRSLPILLLAGVLAAAAPATAATPVHLAEWPTRAAVPAPAPAVEATVEELLRAMTLEEKVGQVIQADIASVTPDDVRQYHLGSVLAGGNAAPRGNLRSSAADWLALTDAYYRASLARVEGHRPIPIIFGIDAVHGHAHVLGATVFPHNVGLGAAHDPALIERVGRATAAEVAATGIDWTFAPTVAVVRDVRWGRSYESWSDDPAQVAAYARAMVTGLQGRPGTPEFMAPGRTLASVKHFLGDGGTVDGRDQFDNRADERTLARVHGAGYPAALDAGAMIVMASYNGWHGTKMHANRDLLTGVLKEHWGFPGFVVGDWNAQEEIPGCTKFDCPAVLGAGLDMYMAPDSWKGLYASLLDGVRAGKVDRARLDDAVRRVLRVKVAAGFLDRPPPRERPGTDPATLGNAEHRALAREAVRASLVLLKNRGRVLPLDAGKRILVAGSAADDVGRQCGGWTIDWQGDHNTNADFPGSTSIWSGIREAVERAGGVAEYSPDGTFRERPSAAVVVFGEGPYAEFEGDRETVEYSPAQRGDLELLKRLRKAGIPVVAVFLSGRPLWVNPELNAADAFVAAWWPGTEGGGVADLLFRPAPGAPRHDFTGRLSFPWPATGMPVRYRADGSVEGALYPRGYGLSLADDDRRGPLSEDPRLPPERRARNTLFAAGHVTAPWSLYVADPLAEVRLTMHDQPSPAGAVAVALDDQGFRGRWFGRGPGELRVGGRARDVAGLARDGIAVRVNFRVDSSPAGRVGAGLRCEPPYGENAPRDPAGVDWSRCGLPAGATLDLTPTLAAARPGEWRTLEIPVRCFADAGARLDRVSSLLAFRSDGRFTLTVRDARLVPSRAACPGPMLGRNP